MNLVVEIGNTALKAAWTEGVTLGKTFRYQGERPIDYIARITQKEKPKVMAVASMADIQPAEERRLKGMCSELLILDGSHKQILERYGLPSYLTYDRASSLVAVKSMFAGKSCTVMDFGTTLSVDFLSADGTYEGGNLSLGCRTRFKALNRYTRTLPLVDTPVEIEPLGLSLRSSIESGIIRGIMFEIQAYIDSRPDNLVVFTGGDAIYFVKKMKNSIFAVCNLVLMGLAQITDDYVG